jgi:hypothetical protein
MIQALKYAIAVVLIFIIIFLLMGMLVTGLVCLGDISCTHLLIFVSFLIAIILAIAAFFYVLESTISYSYYD